MKISNVCFATLVGLGLTSAAMAAEATPLQTMTKSSKLKVEVRTELENNDHGELKTEDSTPSATTRMSLKAMKLGLSGDVNSKVKYKYRYNFATNRLDYGYVAGEMGPVSLLVGQNKVLQGGWEQQENSTMLINKSTYNNKGMPLLGYQPMIQASMELAGTLALQVTNDQTAAKASWATGKEADKQPAMVLAWMGDFNGIMPLIQIGQYDYTHSRWIALGVKTSMKGLDARFDYIMDSQSEKTPDGTNFKDEFNEVSTMTLYVGYEVKGTVKPYLSVSTYDVKQHTSDAKTNGIIDAAEGANSADNAMDLSVGTHVMLWDESLMPYVAYVSKSGTFTKSATDDAEVTRTQSKMLLGVASIF